MILRELAAAAALALLAASPAAAEVVQQSPEGFVVRTTAETTAAPGSAWSALVAPAAWWNKAHTFSGDAANLSLDPRPGGCFCEQLPLSPVAPAGAPRGGVEHMRVVFADPGKALRMVGSLGPLGSEALTGTLTITLKPAGSGTRILWEYVVGGYMRYKTEEIAPAVDKVLSGQLASLVAALGPAAPAPKTPPAKGR